MVKITEIRARYKYGTHDAGYYRLRAVADPTLGVKVFDKTIMVVLFGAHLMYRQRLQSTRVNGVIYVPDFQKLMQSLVIEWAGKSSAYTVYRLSLANNKTSTDSNLLVS